MDTCIGAPSANCAHRLCCKRTQRAFQVILNSVAIALALPPGIGLTLIADAEGQSHAKTNPESDREFVRLGQLGEEAFCLGLEGTGCFGHNFFYERTRTVAVADGEELFR